jgi:hypothetical protein
MGISGGLVMFNPDLLLRPLPIQSHSHLFSFNLGLFPFVRILITH